jgi:tetratricopeptide (TPR) repeat protein
LPRPKKKSLPPEPAGTFSSPEKRNHVLCLLLAVLTLALYNPVSRHPFVNYDDDRYVTENSHVRAGLTWSTISWATTATEQGNWHPLAWMSHALDVSLFRLNPAGHHFTSVLLHTLNAILLFLLLAAVTGRAGPSLFVAAAFAVHPINVESVAWVAERKNVLCTLFFLLTLMAYGWYARKPGWQRYLGVTALFVAGLASKPMVITLPFVLLLWDYWPLGRAQESGQKSNHSPGSYSWQRLLVEKLPLLALSLASAVITMNVQQAGGAVRSITQFSFGVRLANAICAYFMYLWKMLWPARLAPMYPHPGNSLPAWQIAFSAFVLLVITVGVYKFRSHRYLVVGWFWFLGTLVPVIGLVQVGDAAMADRYAYIPLIGVFMMIAFGAADLMAAKNVGLAWQPILGAMALILMALVTHRQIEYWRSNVELWTHTLAVTQNNFVAEDNLGGALAMEGKPDEAFAHFQAASRINPDDPMSRSNLGAYFQTHGQTAEAISEYKAAIARTTDAALLAQAYANLGVAQRALGQDEPAQQSFDQALQFNPNQANAWFGEGMLAQGHGRLNDAIADFSHSVELQPTGERYLNLGRSLQRAGRLPEALAAYRGALKLSPNLLEAQQAADELSANQR